MSQLTAVVAGGRGVATEEHAGFWADAYPIIPHPGELIIGIVAFVILYCRGPTQGRARASRRCSPSGAAAIEGGIEKAEQAQAEAAGGAGAVPGPARRGPRGGRPDPRGGARRRARRSSPRCASRRRPRPRGSPPRRTQQIEADRQQAVGQLRAEVGRPGDRARLAHRRRVPGGRRPPEPRRRPLPRRARGR